MMKHTVLVVDDEPDVVKSVQDLLRLDYRVLGATRAQDAIEILERDEVHIVMTDQRMPGITGVEFLSRVRGEHPEAIRLLFTGYADIRAVIDAINQGNVYRYITKPWDPDELQGVIREACERFDLLVERKRLFALLQTQNRDLERANVELSRANELKLAFIQVASHELRTPLTILLGLTGVAARAGAASEDQPALLNRIDQAGRRLQRLMDQLITMLAAGQFDRTLERKPTDLAPILKEAADDVRPFVALRHQEFAVDIAPDLGTAVVDAGKVRDSINHLLLNAVKFTADGGRIALDARRIHDGEREIVEIRVSDNGIGIRPEARQQLFEPFFTGFDVSRHSSGVYEHGKQGIGLGLSIVRAFVEMHGGTITAESELGRGSAFVVRFSVDAPQAGPGATSTKPAPSITERGA